MERVKELQIFLVLLKQKLLTTERSWRYVLDPLVLVDVSFDIDNVKILYEALKKLPLSTAIDERFWAYQTHVDFFDYMRNF